MSTYAALQHTMFLGGYDLGPDLTMMGLNIQSAALEDTRFGMVARSRIAGLEDVTASANGFHQVGVGLNDQAIWDAVTSQIQVITQTPSGAAGDVAYFHQASKFGQSLFGEVGVVAPFSIATQGVRGSGTLSVGAVRGRLLVPKGNISATGVAGSVVQAGAVPSGKYLYCAVHCFSIGTSFTLQIQSDNASNFPSATTQMTTSSITAVGGTWVTRVAGPITDDYWRVNVSAVTGTSNIAVAIGIK